MKTSAALLALLIVAALSVAGAFAKTVTTGHQWWLLLFVASCVLTIGTAIRLIVRIPAAEKSSQN